MDTYYHCDVIVCDDSHSSLPHSDMAWRHNHQCSPGTGLQSIPLHTHTHTHPPDPVYMATHVHTQNFKVVTTYLTRPSILTGIWSAVVMVTLTLDPHVPCQTLTCKSKRMVLNRYSITPFNPKQTHTTTMAYNTSGVVQTRIREAVISIEHGGYD